MNNIQIYDENVGVESFFIRVMSEYEDCGAWIKFTFLKSNSNITFKVWSTYFNRSSVEHSSKVYPIESVSFDNYSIRWPDGELFFNQCCSGQTKKHKFSFFWDVTDDKPIKLLPKFLYSNSIPTTKLITPFPRMSVSGKLRSKDAILFDCYKVDRGMFGHNWSPKHSREYVWTFSNSSMFSVEGFSTLIFPFKFTSVCVRYQGEDYLFSDILRPIRMSSSYDLFDFEWKASKSNINGNRLKLFCIGYYPRSSKLTYKNPDGSKMLCLNDNMSNVYVQLETKDGLLGDVAPGALEFLTK